MRNPDFLIIGAAKSGTTALFHYLGQHPQIYTCPVREPNFFALEHATINFTGPGDAETIGQNSVTERLAYNNLFDQAKPGQVAGEVSPLYLYQPETAQRIKDYVPDAKLIAVLRQPVDRAYASFLHLRRDRRESETSFRDALKAEQERIAAGWEHLWHYQGMGNYASQLRRYYASFSRNQIKVILYDDFLHYPKQVLESCFKFLEVDTEFQPDTSRRPNQSGIPRSYLLQKVLAGANPMKRLVSSVLPERIKGGMVSVVQRWNLSKPELDPTLRKELLKSFETEILELQDLIGRDLTHWLEN